MIIAAKRDAARHIQSVKALLALLMQVVGGHLNPVCGHFVPIKSGLPGLAIEFRRAGCHPAASEQPRKNRARDRSAL
jgi:hypothetical protein